MPLLPALSLLLLLPGCAWRGLNYPGSLRPLRGYTPAPVDEATAAQIARPPELPAPSPLPAPAARPAPAPRPSAPAVPAGDELGDAIVASARALLDSNRLEVDGVAYRQDCVGMVQAAYALNGRQLISSIAQLYAQAEGLGVLHADPFPLPGDVAFFDDTYDKNRNGERDDPLSHVAVVESVDADGTITLIHLGGGGDKVARTYMNLQHPDLARSPDGRTLNSPIRSTQSRDGGPVLTGELFVAFGSLWSVPADALAEAPAPSADAR